MPDHDDATDLLIALRDVGVAELSHEALESRVRSALVDEIARERTRHRPRGRALRPGVGGLLTVVSMAVSISIAVAAIALLSHKPRTAVRSAGDSRVTARSHRDNNRSRIPSVNGYQPVSANVIGRDPSLWYSTIEIDKGRKDGVALNDPVIGDGALVGRIASVTPTVSIVDLITDPSFAVAARVQDGSRDTGVLVPEVGNPMGLLLLLDLPNQAQVTSGQQVVTAGISRGSLASLYPAGIPIGQISNPNRNENLSQGQVPVTPTADIRHLATVQILTFAVRAVALAGPP